MSMNGEQVYDNFQQGKGTSRLEQLAGELLKLQKTYKNRAESIVQIQEGMGSAWTGDGASAAREGAGPLKPALLESAGNIDATVDSVQTQSGDWNRAARSVEPVPPAPEKPNPWTTGLKAAIPVAGPFMASDDLKSYQSGVEAHNRAAQNNVDVMSAYSNQTNSNSSFPTSYGVMQPGGAAISVASGSAPNAISGDLTYSDTTTRSSTVAGPVGSGVQPGSGPVSGAVPNVGSPVATGSGAPAPAPGPIGPSAGTPPPAPAPSPGTGVTAAGAVPVGGTSSTGNTSRPGNTPGRTSFGTTATPRTGTGTGSGTSRGTGERAGSRLYGPGSGSGSGAGGAGRGSVGGVGSGGSAGDAAARALGAGKGTGAAMPGGAASAAESAAAKGASGTRGAGMGAMGPAGAGRANREEDEEHQRPEYLQENDPDEVFIGDLGKTSPPVIGE
ncbi:hypothetical protein [Prauserella cavernicola]|uniref:PPE domain-containing protein n=1 Tax=Prauserella cavernicola TaxID=2800127 RepID=A0A934V2H1_9PSEU|nr:hypothetical protein [Prauserella cavernicola]MBK1785726.1 hypothetical protein [Prauserella cavernicola]